MQRQHPLLLIAAVLTLVLFSLGLCAMTRHAPQLSMQLHGSSLSICVNHAMPHSHCRVMF